MSDKHNTTYRPQSTNASIEADQLTFQLLAQHSNAERIAMTAKFTKGARKLSLRGLKATFGHLDPDAFRLKVAQTWLGDRWPDGFELKGDPVSWIQDSIELANQLHLIFERLGIAYYITGGVAATTYGEIRTTIDLDLVLKISRNELLPLVSALESENFYIPGVEDAVSGRMNTLQITHQETVAQADLAISGNDAWDALKFQRRRLIEGLYFVSPEDLILNKLRWRQRTQSEKQWRDVLGILKTQQAALEYAYMRQRATALDLLIPWERALAEAGVKPLAD